ncbi:MAG: serine/threonine protein kinase [Sandaracinaceae bacterium]
MGPYHHVCPIAQGGMAAVTLVVKKDGAFMRPYAMKRFLPHAGTEEAMRDMLSEEARIAGMLRHPNLVSVLDVGRDERGPYLVMDYVEGISLSELLIGLPDGDEVPIQIALRILVQIARGLSAAHELTNADGEPLELVHRDMSPQNVLIDVSGVVRVADFGIARAVGRSTNTTTGVLKGKMSYMAPEQLRFEAVDQRADLFSFGVVAYELFTARRLYREASSTDSARRILHEPPPDLGLARPDAPDVLTELTFSLLAKDPSHRPRSARAVADRLDTVLAELVAFEGPEPLDGWLAARIDTSQIAHRRELLRTFAEPISSTELRPRARARSRGGAIALASVAALAFGIGGYALYATLGEGEDAPPDPSPVLTSLSSEPPPIAPSAEPDAGAPGTAPEPEEREVEAEHARRGARRRGPRRRNRGDRNRGDRNRGDNVPVIDVY